MDSMQQLIEINKSIIQKFFNHCSPKNLFILLLEGLKDEYSLNLLLDADILEQSIRVLDCIESDPEIAKMINSILNIMCDIEYDFIHNRNYIIILLKKYFELMDRGYYVINNIKDTLYLFSVLGIEKSCLIYKVIKCYSEKRCVEIFSKLGFDLEGLNFQISKKLLLLMERGQKLSNRFGLIFHFYLMTEKDYIENIKIAGEYFKLYHSHMMACADWGFSSERRYEDYVKDGIISKEENNIFVEIGDLYYDCMDEEKISGSEELEEKDIDKDLEELFEKIEVASARFAIRIKAKDVQDLLKKFFYGKSLFEAAFHLPDHS